MKRQILTLIAVLTLVVAGALFAQSGGYGSAPAPSPQTSAQQPSSLPPSQQVDQSGKPETGPGPDVDVDTGRNADNGVLDVDVTKNTDPDTAAQDNDHPNTNLNNNTTGTTYGNDTTTGAAADTDNLPNTGSEMPLVGLIGLLALGAAVVVRSIR